MNIWCRLGLHDNEKIDTFENVLVDIGDKLKAFRYQKVEQGFVCKCKRCKKETREVSNTTTTKTTNRVK